MKYSKDLGFAVVHRDLPIGKHELNCIKKAFSFNKKIFKSTPKKFDIFICDEEECFRVHAKYWYRKAMTATVLLDNTIVTRSPEMIKKINGSREFSFEDIMNHEMNHAFLGKYYTGANPVWIVEGLACYAGKNPKIPKFREVDYSILEYRYIKKKFRKNKFFKYGFWRGFIEYIDKKYSVDKLIELMKEYGKNPVKSNYDRLFRKLFKKSERELFREYMKEWRKND